MRLVDSLLFTTKAAIPPLRLVLRRPAKPALEGRAAGTRAGRHGGKAPADSLLFTRNPAIDALGRPWFETRRCATLLTMRSAIPLNLVRRPARESGPRTTAAPAR